MLDIKVDIDFSQDLKDNMPEVRGFPLLVFMPKAKIGLFRFSYRYIFVGEQILK